MLSYIDHNINIIIIIIIYIIFLCLQTQKQTLRTIDYYYDYYVHIKTDPRWLCRAYSVCPTAHFLAGMGHVQR
jgi:hypothetical protein